MLPCAGRAYDKGISTDVAKWTGDPLPSRFFETFYLYGSLTADIFSTRYFILHLRSLSLSTTQLSATFEAVECIKGSPRKISDVRVFSLDLYESVDQPLVVFTLSSACFLFLCVEIP